MADMKLNEGLDSANQSTSIKQNHASKQIWPMIQMSLFEIFNQALDLQVFTPFTYSLVLILSFIQQLHLLQYDMSIVQDQAKGTMFEASTILSYLPIFPIIRKEGSKNSYIVIFIILFSMQMIFISSLLFNFLYRNAKSSQKSSMYKPQIQIGSTKKIILKILTFYLVIQREFFLIPSIYFSIDMMVCGKENRFSQDIIFSIQKHDGTGLECWSQSYVALLSVSVMHITLILLQYWIQEVLFTDKMNEVDIPWASQTQSPEIINLLINISYILWILLTKDNQLKIILDIICLFLSLVVLFLRLQSPLFKSKTVKKVRISYEVGRFWVVSTVIIKKMFATDSTIVGTLIEIIIFFCLIVLFLTIINQREQSLLLSGLDKIKDSTHLEVFLDYIYKLINIDKKKKSFLLQGILQTHIQRCLDRNCPCSVQQNKYLRKLFKANLEKEQKKAKILHKASNQFQQANLIENQFMNQFQTRKASDLVDIKRKRLNKQYEQVQQTSNSSDDDQSFKERHWNDFLRYHLPSMIKNIKMNADLHYILSCFYFSTIKNEFQSLFELIQAKDLKPDLQQSFFIYRQKMRIESVIFQKHDKISQASKKLNILLVFEYEKNYTLFQKHILQNTLSCYKFWSEMLEKDLDVAKLHKTGIEISKNHHVVTQTANRLLEIYPNQLVMLLDYAKYLNDVINNEYSAADIFQKTLQQRVNLRQKQKMQNNNENEDLLFGENSFCSIFVLKAEGRSLGIIEYVNEEIENLLGFSSRELIGKDINTIIPRNIAKVHTQLLKKFFEKAESSVLNKVRELFARDKDGYLVPVYLFSKVLPSLYNGLKLVGVVKKIKYLTFQPEVPSDFAKMPHEYIICDSENNIQNFTYGMTTTFGLFPKMFISSNGNSLFDQDVSIDYLSAEIIDANDEMKRSGAIITINTNRIFEKVDREVLSNEEYKYFLEKAGDIKVFCQMMETSFSNLTTIKLYRIIHFQKFAYTSQQVTQSISELTHDDDGKSIADGLSSFVIQSASQSSSSNSTTLSMDSQLKEFKKQMTDNIEPRLVTVMKKLMMAHMYFTQILTSLIFAFLIAEITEQMSEINQSLKAIQLHSKVLQIQTNIRSKLNIANSIEYGYKLIENSPFDDRYEYLNNVNIDLLEEIRSLNLDLKFTNDNDTSILVHDISISGTPHEYNLTNNHAMSQYVVRALDLEQASRSNLIMPIIDWKASKDEPIKDKSLFQSAYFVINTGFKTILKQLKDIATLKLEEQASFESGYQEPVVIICIIDIIFVVISELLMIASIQIIESNKIRILSLYSEIKVSEAKESQGKCVKFYKYLLNERNDDIQPNEQKIDGIIRRQSFTDQNELNMQWNIYVQRLQLLRENPQKQAVHRLQKRLALGQEYFMPGELNSSKFRGDQSVPQNHNDVKASDSPIQLKDQTEEKKIKSKNNDENHSMNVIKPTRGDAGNFIRRKQKKKTRDLIQRDESIEDSKEEDGKSQSSDGSHKQEQKRKIKEKNQILGIDENEESLKIGKYEQFTKIQRGNWAWVIFITTKTSIICAYFIFIILFQASIKEQINAIAKHLDFSYSRQISVNTLFSYFRERMLTGEELIPDIEKDSLEQFYANENLILDQLNGHESFVDFLYDFFSTQDSKAFCSNLMQIKNITNCGNFSEGLLDQGYKSALFTFANFYNRANFSTLDGNKSKLLNSLDMQQLLVASETYLYSATVQLDQIWTKNLRDMENTITNIHKVLFAIFMIAFFFLKTLVTPRVLNQLNEITWRSRGILNLVPNSIFREMKRDSKMYKMLKL